MIKLITVWETGATGVKDLERRLEGLTCIKRTDTGWRDRLSDLGHILAS